MIGRFVDDFSVEKIIKRCALVLVYTSFMIDFCNVLLLLTISCNDQFSPEVLDIKSYSEKFVNSPRVQDVVFRNVPENCI